MIEPIAGIPLPEGLQVGDRIDISNLGSPAHAALYSANGLFGLPLGVTYQLMRCSCARPFPGFYSSWAAGHSTAWLKASPVL